MFQVYYTVRSREMSRKSPSLDRQNFHGKGFVL